MLTLDILNKINKTKTLYVKCMGSIRKAEFLNVDFSIGVIDYEVRDGKHRLWGCCALSEFNKNWSDTRSKLNR